MFWVWVKHMISIFVYLILSITQVCSRWVELASHLQLGHHVQCIGGARSRVSGHSDRSRLSSLLKHWQVERPGLFTLDTLLSILHQLHLRDMEMWIRIITAGLGCFIQEINSTTGLVILANDSCIKYH